MRTFPLLFDIMSIKTRTLCTYLFFLLSSIFLQSTSANAQVDPATLMLQFETNQGCGDFYCATIQTKVKEEGETVKIGTSSIFVEYNAGALDFASYTSIHFDEEDIACVSNLFSPWQVQGVDGNEPGKVNIVMTLSENLKDYSCPIINSDEWLDVGVICFTILNNNMPANITFSQDPARTNFNINDPNDGSVTVPVDYDNLGSVTESPQNDISAPIIGNSSDTYELCASGTGQPSSITLGINTPVPNGFVPIWQRDGVDLPVYNTIDVEVSDFTFNPPTFVIYTGDTVRWTNVEGNHNVNGTQAAYPANPASFTNGPAASGNWTFDQVFNTSGVYYYQSDPDVNVNMSGSISVYQNTFQNKIIYEPGLYTVYLRSLNDPSCTSEVSNGLVITERDCTTNPEPTCPSVNIINDEQFHCEGAFNGAGLVLNWQTGIEIGNDPSNAAGDIIVSGSPIGSTGFPTAQPSGVYAGDGCNVDVQSFYAAVECDLDNDGVVDSYVAAGEFTLNIYPAPQAPTIVPSYNATSQTCGFYFTAACPGDNLVYDITTLTTVTCAEENLTSVSVDVNNGNGCSDSFIIGRTNCQECSGSGCEPVTSNESASDAACTGTVVDLNSYLTNTPGVFTWSIDGNSIANPSSYELTATGCTNNAIVANGYYTENVTGCVDEYFMEISFTIYPEINATVEESSCSVTLNGACSNYEVIWTDNLGSSGMGTSYTTDFSESGNVAFIVTNPNAMGDCSSKQFEGVFDCNNCPTEVVDLFPTASPVCADEAIDLNDYDPENAVVEWFDIDGNSVVDGLITFENNTCEFTSAYFDGFYEANQDGCVVEYHIHLDLSIHPNLRPNVVVNECAVNLENLCGHYLISWIDSEGNMGNGPNFSAASGTTGTVTFRLLNEEGQCNVYEVDADYNCQDTNCEIDSTLAMNVVGVCQGVNVNLDDYSEAPEGVNVIWEQEFENGSLQEINPNGIIAETESCSVGTNNYYINYIADTNGCTVSFSQKVKLRIYPEITAEIVSDACVVSLDQVCANYDVQWEDSFGNSGSGNSYSGDAGSEGNVAFTVTFANGIEECNTKQFVVAYACDPICNEDETVVLDPLNTEICSDQVINLYDYFDVPLDVAYEIVFGNGDAISDPTAFTLSTTNCNGINRNIYLEYTKQENGCEIAYSQRLFIRTRPIISASISSNECIVELTDYCNSFNVTWTDDLGNSGNGPVYNAPNSSSGTVSFTIENPNAVEVCQSETFEADFLCDLCFPSGGSFFETVSVCSNDIVHLDSFLPNGIDASWTDQNGINVEMSSLEFYTDDCDGSVFTYHAAYYSQDGDCTINYDKTIEVTVYPELDIDIVNTACAVGIQLACPNFEMSWADSFGNSGTEANYSATDGSTGSLTVTVSNPSAPINCDIEKTILFDCPEKDASEVDLEISVAIDNVQGEYNIGDNVNFVIGIRNTSSVNATNIVVLNLLPEGIDYDGHLPSAGGYSPANGYWNIPQLGANSFATLIVQGILTQNGSIENIAEIMSVDQNDDDSTPGNSDAVEDDYGRVSLNVVPIAETCIPNECDDKDYGCIQATDLTEICVEFCGLTMPCDVTSAISENGSPTLINQGCFMIDPSSSAIASGFEIVAMEGEDFNGNCAKMMLHISIGNCGPVIQAEDDFYSVSSSDETMLNVIGNDNGSEIQVCEILEAPEKGTVEITGNGISYTPNSNASGTDHLVYEICDEFGSVSSATIYLEFSTACEIEDIHTCTSNTASIVLCVNFCGNDMDVTNINTLFGSNAEMLTNRCFKYIPDANSSGEDHITIEGCNVLGECETVNAYVEISDNCSSARLADPSINLFDNIPECEISIPTIITPNNDGVNDLLESKALYECYQDMQFEFCIFNRNGQIVHKLDQEEFNGILWNNNMDLMNEGVYYYALTITDGVNRKSQTGYIELRK